MTCAFCNQSPCRPGCVFGEARALAFAIAPDLMQRAEKARGSSQAGQLQPGYNDPRKVVELDGIEPTTSSLQSSTMESAGIADGATVASECGGESPSTVQTVPLVPSRAHGSYSPATTDLPPPDFESTPTSTHDATTDAPRRQDARADSGVGAAKRTERMEDGTNPPHPLTRMSSAISAQDSAGTAHPIFMVQRSRRVYGFDPDYADGSGVWLDDEGNEVRDWDFMCPSCQRPLTKASFRDERCEDCGGVFDPGYFSVTHTAYQDFWENVQPFFTRQGAEEYLCINGHNLQGERPPRIYIESAFRNAEWQAVRGVLLALGRIGDILWPFTGKPLGVDDLPAAVQDVFNQRFLLGAACLRLVEQFEMHRGERTWDRDDDDAIEAGWAALRKAGVSR